MSIWNRVKLPLIIAGIGSAVIALIVVSKPKPAPMGDALAEPPKTQVHVKPAVTEQVTLSVFSQGTVQPKREIDLVAQVSGQVMSASDNFLDGAFFSANSPLIVIDQRDYQAALLNAEALYAQAERAVAQERGKSLQAKREWRDLGNQASNDLFLRKPQLAEANAQLASASANLQTAKLNLERTRVSAPFDGRIIDTAVDLGQFVTVGTPIANVYDTAVAEIRIPLTDRQIAKLDLPLFPDPNAQHILPDVVLRGTIAGEQHEWQGRITRTEGAVDVNSRMYYALAEVTNAFSITDGRTPMVPGLFVEAEIAGKTRSDVIKLPTIALVKRNFIYTLSDDDEVELTHVNVLRKANGEAWVVADIDATIRIVLEKHALLTVGTAVAPDVSPSVENIAANTNELADVSQQNSANIPSNVNDEVSTDDVIATKAN